MHIPAPFQVAIAMVTAMAATLPSAGAAPLAVSTFDRSAEGWLVKDLPYPDPGSPPVVLGTYTPTFNASGGDPGGHLSRLDVSANAWYWSAPAKFLGDIGTAYGGTLSYSMAVTGDGFGNPPNFTQEDVILVGGGKTLVYDTGRVVLDGPKDQVLAALSGARPPAPASQGAVASEGGAMPAAPQPSMPPTAPPVQRNISLEAAH